MQLDKIKYAMKSMIVLFALSIACLFLQISQNIVLYDDYGIRPDGDTNRFFGIALLLCVVGLIVSIYTHYQYKKTKR